MAEEDEESWVDSWLSSLKANLTGGRVERKQAKPENAKQKPIVRQIIKTAFPNLSTVQAGNLVDFAAPHMAGALKTKIGANPSQKCHCRCAIHFTEPKCKIVVGRLQEKL